LTVTGHQTVLRFRWPVDLALTVASHGWVYLAPWQWEPGTGRLARIDDINGRTGTIEIAQRDPDAVVIRWDGFGPGDEAEVLARVRRWLSADWEPSEALTALPEEAALIQRGGGRLLRGSSLYEDFVKTVLTINTSWSGTCRMVAALVAEPGGGGFPGPEALLDYGEERLRERAKLGFRARTVVQATRRMLDDGAITPAGEGHAGRLGHDYLISLKGIGPYAAAHCRLLLHDFSRIPVDSGVITYLRERYGCDPAAFAASRSSWGPYLALGYRLGRLREKLDRADHIRSNETVDGSSPASIPNLARSATIHSRMRPTPRLSSDQASTTPRKRRSLS
jgi:3-methyladenine DNA glycosylase/8-oxoguanine DNA glycosylase